MFVGCGCILCLWGFGAMSNIIMPQTRKSANKFQNRQKCKQYERSRTASNLVQAMMEEMSENNVDPEILVPINSQIEMMGEELQRKSFIIMGPGHGGKTAAVHWLTRNIPPEQKNIIWIDCRYWHSDNAFVKQLLEEVSSVFKRQLKKPLVMKQGLNFKELNSQIQKQKVQIIIVIKNPERLVEQGRPVLLYNIFEWMNCVHSSYLHIIIVSREIKFVDNQQKRVKSRMNAPILFCTRPRFNKIKDIINRRIEHCMRVYPQKEKFCSMLSMLKRGMEQKEVERIINSQIEKKAVPISHYLKIFQLILAINIESEQKWITLSQKDINAFICEGFENYSVYLVDHRTIAKSFFSTSNIPQLILMGLYRNRFLRQKQGHYTCPITLGQLMNDYNLKKSQVRIEQGGNSFLYSEHVMERALKNLIDWNLLTLSKISEKVAMINREIDSRYGPEDIQYFYQEVQNMPNIVQQIYMDK